MRLSEAYNVKIVHGNAEACDVCTDIDLTQVPNSTTSQCIFAAVRSLENEKQLKPGVT